MAKPAQKEVEAVEQMEKAWYVIWTLARNERRLISRIHEDISPEFYSRCWTPKKKERQKHEGKLQDVERILFPGYVFIETDVPVEAEEAIESLIGETGMIRFLKTDDTFHRIENDERELIECLTGENGVADVSIGIIKDGRLKVVDGPLKGLEQYVVKIDRHERKAWLKMRLLGEERKFTMGLQIVEKS